MPETPAALMEQLYEEHAAALWVFCLRLTGHDRSRAEDVVQETLLRAWRNSHVLERPPGSLRSWLYTVARNIVIDEWRTHRSERELPVAEVPEHDARGDKVDELLLSWIVADALQKLSVDHRAVLRECYYRGASVAEAADRLGIPPGTVKSRSHYALRALALALEEMGVSP
ncbi:MAG TPA: sigma-70 family RNA polymerase sigma factor [Nocardioides sp.]|uniref:sigma-70 family RNA polymerase sigma factor n=1 Tax=Nocardioides sp. TaxID=35761 RepID=UPI002D7E4725|nr:sigma-70 family RNA polymerase sigma factor [Nocardioides sp.]HET6653197.1 sigma-70 family RNA polymerase sigma factor [Nocardioides sp.]